MALARRRTGAPQAPAARRRRRALGSARPHGAGQSGRRLRGEHRGSRDGFRPVCRRAVAAPRTSRKGIPHEACPIWESWRREAGTRSTSKVDCAICRASSPTSRPTICPARRWKSSPPSPHRSSRRSPARRDWVRRSRRSASSSRSVSTTPIMPRKRTFRCRPSRSSFRRRSPRSAVRTTPSSCRGVRRRRTGRSSSASSSARKRAYVERADALAHVAGYCVVNDVSRARVPDRARRHLGQGQGLRHLRPGRPLAGDHGRDRRSAGARPVARRQRPAHAERQHAHDDLRCAPRSSATSAAS